MLQYLRPLWRLLRIYTLPRGLLVAHAQAFGQLACLELARELALWRRRALLQVLGLGAALCAAALGGVALLLWAVVPPAQVHAAWLLWAVPLLPALLALGCLAGLWAARRSVRAPAFAAVRRQLAADLALVQGAGRRAP